MCTICTNGKKFEHLKPIWLLISKQWQLDTLNWDAILKADNTANVCKRVVYACIYICICMYIHTQRSIFDKIAWSNTLKKWVMASQQNYIQQFLLYLFIHAKTKMRILFYYKHATLNFNLPFYQRCSMLFLE